VISAPQPQSVTAVAGADGGGIGRKGTIGSSLGGAPQRIGLVRAVKQDTMVLHRTLKELISRGTPPTDAAMMDLQQRLVFHKMIVQTLLHSIGHAVPVAVASGDADATTLLDRDDTEEPSTQIDFPQAL